MFCVFLWKIPLIVRNVRAFYLNVSAFVRNVRPFYLNVPAFVRNVRSFYLNVPSFVRNVRSFYLNVPTFVRNVRPFYLNVPTFVRNIPSLGQKILFDTAERESQYLSARLPWKDNSIIPKDKTTRLNCTYRFLRPIDASIILTL